MELCLGTVQFGMDYGLLNTPKPDENDAIRLIDYATQNGVYAIDTAKAYGTAEEVVGKFLKRHTLSRENLFLSTKFTPNKLDGVDVKKYQDIIEKEIVSQLKTLHTDYVDAYVFHSSRYAFDKTKLEALRIVVDKGYARKCGVSVYEPEEAMACYKSGLVDFIQAPYSVFDHRMKKAGVFEGENKGNCEIHTRSAFIQGLIVMEESQIPPFLKKAKPIIKKIKELCDEQRISRTQVALQYVKRENSVSHLVFGVDSLEQLKEDIVSFREEISNDLIAKIGAEFDDLEADIVMPSLWKR